MAPTTPPDQPVQPVQPDQPDQPESSKFSWKTVLITALVVLLLAEVGARVLGTKLNDPDWNVPELAEHIDNLERITEDEGSTIDTLIIGSSSPGAGIDPVQLAAASDRVDLAYNGNLFGPPAGAIHQVADQILLPETDPDIVVLGITSRALNDNSIDLSRMQDSLVTSTGWRRAIGEASSFDGLNQAAANVSALVKYRPLLRDPEQVARRITEPGDIPISDLGKLTDRDGRTYELNSGHEAQERSALSDWGIDTDRAGGAPSEFDELRSLIELIEGQGRELVLVDMPVLDRAWWPMHPDPERARIEYAAAIESLVAETGVDYWNADAEHSWTEADFGDPNHLNDVGAKRLTTLLAERIDASTSR